MKESSHQRHTSSGLRDAIAARNAAREKLAKATTDLERAERVSATAKADVDRYDRHADEAQAAHARAVEDHIVSGATGAPPVFLTNEREAKAQRSAADQYAIAQRALATLKTNHAAAQASVEHAEQSVRDAAIALLLADANKIAEKIIELEDATIAERVNLIGLIDHPLLRGNGTPGRSLISQAVIESLHPRVVVPGSGILKPRYAEELLNGEKFRIKQALEKWNERIAAMIECANIESSEADAPQDAA